MTFLNRHKRPRLVMPLTVLFIYCMVCVCSAEPQSNQSALSANKSAVSFRHPPKLDRDKCSINAADIKQAEPLLQTSDGPDHLDIALRYGIPGFFSLVCLLLTYRFDKRKKSWERDIKGYELRISPLYQRRIDVIDELFELFSDMRHTYYCLTSRVTYEGQPTKEEMKTNLHDAWGRFVPYFRAKQVYLPKSLCSRIVDFIREVDSGMRDHNTLEKYPTGREFLSERASLLQELDKREASVAEISEAIEVYLRHLLGTETD